MFFKKLRCWVLEVFFNVRYWVNFGGFGIKWGIYFICLKLEVKLDNFLNIFILRGIENLILFRKFKLEGF